MSGYKFSRREIARCKCIDCGVNVIRAGDYCMLKPQIWETELRLGWSAVLVRMQPGGLDDRVDSQRAAGLRTASTTAL